MNQDKFYSIKELMDKYQYKRANIYKLYNKGYLERKYVIKKEKLCVFYKIVKVWSKRNEPPFIEGWISQHAINQWAMKGYDPAERRKFGRYMYFKALI